MKKHAYLICLLCSLFVSTQVVANDTKSGTVSDTKKTVFQPSGYAAFQGVQLVKYKYKGLDNAHSMTVNTVLNIGLSIFPFPNFRINTGIEGNVWFSTIPHSEIFATPNDLMEPNWTFYIHQSDMVFSFGNKEKFSGEIGVGYFPYKYNPEVYNLGEYLFRSGTYPGWLITNFGWPKARLAGFRLSGTNHFSNPGITKWTNDILLTTEIETYPYFDLSLSYITSAKFIRNLFDIGAGISFCRFISNNPELTTPHKTFNIADIKIRSTGNFDTLPGIDTLYDSTFYTFKGIKLMCRLTIDPKVLLPENMRSVFGEADGKIYCEFDILGIANQGGPIDSTRLLYNYYSKLNERIPFTFGFHVPTFKIFDVIAIEFEYYASPYPNDYGPQLRFADIDGGGIPIPYTGEPDTDYDIATGIYNKDNWKWSIYFEKSIRKHFIIVGQLARDHRRTFSSFGSLKLDTEESLTRGNHWYWALKFVSVF